jgi:dihydrofolate reductase
MRRVIEYTLISADGVFDLEYLRFFEYRDDAYLRDGLGVLTACDAMLMGRQVYDTLARVWPARTDPWANRINAMPKYVFSSTLKDVTWTNSTIVKGNVATEVTKLKRQSGGDLLVWGHTQFAESLMRAGLIDILDLSIHPVLLGEGKLFWREGLGVDLKLVSAKAFSKIVKLSYEPQYG